MVILQESPNLRQKREVVDLHRRQPRDRDTRAGIELMIQIQRRLGTLEFRSVPDRLAINQELQVVGPYLSGSTDENAEVQLPGFGMYRQHDRILNPIPRALHLSPLHVVEGQRLGISVFAQPESGEFAD